jgi:hypothetical protein
MAIISEMTAQAFLNRGRPTSAIAIETSPRARASPSVAIWTSFGRERHVELATSWKPRRTSAIRRRLPRVESSRPEKGRSVVFGTRHLRGPLVDGIAPSTSFNGIWPHAEFDVPLPIFPRSSPHFEMERRRRPDSHAWRGEVFTKAAVASTSKSAALRDELGIKGRRRDRWRQTSPKRSPRRSGCRPSPRWDGGLRRRPNCFALRRG